MSSKTTDEFTLPEVVAICAAQEEKIERLEKIVDALISNQNKLIAAVNHKQKSNIILPRGM